MVIPLPAFLLLGGRWLAMCWLCAGEEPERFVSGEPNSLPSTWVPPSRHLLLLGARRFAMCWLRAGTEPARLED